MRLVRLSVALLAAKFPVGPAYACRVAQSPEQHIARSYAANVISAVALVRIEDARYTQPRVGDAHPWSAESKVVRALRKSVPAARVTFERGWGSAACDDGHPRPKKGELWVIYFWERGPADQAV